MTPPREFGIALEEGDAVDEMRAEERRTSRRTPGAGGMGAILSCPTCGCDLIGTSGSSLSCPGCGVPTDQRKMPAARCAECGVVIAVTLRIQTRLTVKAVSAKHAEDCYRPRPERLLRRLRDRRTTSPRELRDLEEAFC